VLAPIALFVYNRPEHARRTVAALKENTLAPESELFVFSDAPKSPAADSAVQAVRKWARGLDGFRSITLVERDTNWGLAKSIISGVTDLCARYGKVIVLEDDLVVSRGFLEYMNRSLENYAESEKVMQVSGYTLAGGQGSKAFFLPLTTSWGWATWQRAWRHFDQEAKGYATLEQDPVKRKAFDLGGAYPYFEMLAAQLGGKLDSWAILWWLSVFLRDGLVLYPARSLVQNIGFDGSGTHGRNRAIGPGVDTTGDAIEFPDRVAVSVENLDAVTRYLRKNRPGALRNLMKELLSWRG